jgi:carbamoyl-phosphate synthase large subunit
MALVHNSAELSRYIEQSVDVSFDRPVLLDRFLESAVEVDVDAVCDGTYTLIAGIVEHIEHAGVHSGDSSFILPSQTLPPGIVAKIEESTRALAFKCEVRGLMNIQFAVQRGEVYVIEVNPRASRSVPFVSKVTGIPWAKVAARVMAGESLESIDKSGTCGPVLRHLDYQEAIARLKYVAVKESVFPFVKFRGVDATLGPEMRSTGEVMGINRSFSHAFYKGLLGTGVSLPTSGTAFLSLRQEDKDAAAPLARRLARMGFRIIATHGTAAVLEQVGIEALRINKVREGSPHVLDALRAGQVQLVINTPEGSGTFLDSRSIRSTAVELSLPLFTTIPAAEAAVAAIEERLRGIPVEVRSIQEYLAEHLQ